MARVWVRVRVRGTGRGRGRVGGRVRVRVRVGLRVRSGWGRAPPASACTTCPYSCRTSTSVAFISAIIIMT